jgi:hypothetical protein
MTNSRLHNFQGGEAGQEFTAYREAHVVMRQRQTTCNQHCQVVAKSKSQWV